MEQHKVLALILTPVFALLSWNRKKKHVAEITNWCSCNFLVISLLEMQLV